MEAANKKLINNVDKRKSSNHIVLTLEEIRQHSQLRDNGQVWVRKRIFIPLLNKAMILLFSISIKIAYPSRY